MKILLLGDASNYHRALASGLSAEGHKVTLASEGSRWMRTERDIDISRRPGKAGGALLWLRLNTSLAPRLRGYDIVQICGPGFLSLKPVRILKIFERLRRDNGRVFVTALGNDNAYIRSCLGPECPLAYSEWHTPEGPSPWSRSPEAETSIWLSDEMRRFTDAVYTGSQGLVTALYEHQAVFGAVYPQVPVSYAGIPIDTASLAALAAEARERRRREAEAGAPLRILYAAHRGRELEKGADRILRAASEAVARHPGKAVISTPGNVPYSSFLRLLAEADIVLDQAYSYTPATTALLAMALGAVPASGGEEEYYSFIGEDTLRPVINVDPFDDGKTADAIARVIADRELFARMSSQGPEFVKRHNDSIVVAQRFAKAWEKA